MSNTENNVRCKQTMANQIFNVDTPEVPVNLDLALEHLFTLHDVFKDHPLADAVMYEYYLDSEHSGYRFADMSVQIKRFWDIFQIWCLPSDKRLNEWKVDLLGHWLSFQKYVKSADYAKQANLVLDAMVLEIGRRHDIQDVRDRLQSHCARGQFKLMVAEFTKYVAPNRDNTVDVTEIKQQLQNTKYVLHVASTFCRACVSMTEGVREASFKPYVRDNQLLTFKHIRQMATRTQWNDMGHRTRLRRDWWADPRVVACLERRDQNSEPRFYIEAACIYGGVDPTNGLFLLIDKQMGKANRQRPNSDYRDNEDKLHMASSLTGINVPWRNNNNWCQLREVSDATFDYLNAALDLVRGAPNPLQGALTTQNAGDIAPGSRWSDTGHIGYSMKLVNVDEHNPVERMVNQLSATRMTESRVLQYEGEKRSQEELISDLDPYDNPSGTGRFEYQPAQGTRYAENSNKSKRLRFDDEVAKDITTTKTKRSIEESIFVPVFIGVFAVGTVVYLTA